MKHATVAVALAAILSSTVVPGALAQDSLATGPWTFGTTALLALSQSAFSSNWAGGDRGAIVWTLGTDSRLERQFGARFNWSNHLVLAFGQTSKQEPDPDESGDLDWDSPEKSTDKIEFESVGRWTLDTYVDPYVSLRLDSQFLDQSNPLGDETFNPIKLKESAGVARVLRKTEDSEAITRAGFGLRQTIGRTLIADPEVRTEHFTSNDGGLEWQTDVTQPVLGRKILWKAQLLVFHPLFYSRSDALEAFDARVAAGDASRPAEPAAERVADFWKAPDVNLQSAWSAEITKSIGVALFAQLVYDKFDSAANVDNGLPLAVLVPEIRRNVRKAGQFKETLALTLSYRMF
jgi:hypothetical protein